MKPVAVVASVLAALVPAAAARGGRVARMAYDPVLYGHIVVIHGERTRRDYW